MNAQITNTTHSEGRVMERQLVGEGSEQREIGEIERDKQGSNRKRWTEIAKNQVGLSFSGDLLAGTICF